MRICWVDDHLDQARVLAEPLRERGARIDFVAGGADALSALRAERYDAVVTDLRMTPGMWGGLWLLRQMKEAGLTTPCLVLSGEGSQQETIQALRLGATDYVKKADAAAELLERLEVVLADEAKEWLHRLLEHGEDDQLEFKASLRFPTGPGRGWSELTKAERKDISRSLEREVTGTIAAFLNTRGGTLIVGVTDDGGVFGIEGDLETLRHKPSLDGWRLALDSALSRDLGSDAVSCVSVQLIRVEGCALASIACVPRDQPTFHDGTLMIRRGASTIALSTKDAFAYQRDRWP